MTPPTDIHQGVCFVLAEAVKGLSFSFSGLQKDHTTLVTVIPCLGNDETPLVAELWAVAMPRVSGG